MEPQLFSKEKGIFTIELIYDADRSLMRATDLSGAIQGMSSCLKLVGRTTGLDFEDIYISPLEAGSVKAVFRFVKRNKKDILVQTISGSLTLLLFNSFQFIGEHGLASLKHPDAKILASVDKKTLELCMNGDYRNSVGKIAKPLNEINQKVTIKADDKSYEINCDNQYKFISDEEEPILPDLQNGKTVELTGRITRINLDQNDLGFEYEGRRISISPRDPEKAVGKEFHQFLENPVVTITGIVIRESYFETPKIRILSIQEYKPAQKSFFEDEASTSAANKINPPN